MARLVSEAVSSVAVRASLFSLGVAIRGGRAPRFYRRVQLLSLSAVCFPLFVRVSESLPRTTRAILSGIGLASPRRRRATRVLRLAIIFPFSHLIGLLLGVSARTALWLAERREACRLGSSGLAAEIQGVGRQK